MKSKLRLKRVRTKIKTKSKNFHHTDSPKSQDIEIKRFWLKRVGLPAFANNQHVNISLKFCSEAYKITKVQTKRAKPQVAQADRQTDKEYMDILRKIHGYF